MIIKTTGYKLSQIIREFPGKGTDLPLALPYGSPNLPDQEPSDGLLLGYNRLFSFSVFLFEIEHIFICQNSKFLFS